MFVVSALQPCKPPRLICGDADILGDFLAETAQIPPYRVEFEVSLYSTFPSNREAVDFACESSPPYGICKKYM